MGIERRFLRRRLLTDSYLKAQERGTNHFRQAFKKRNRRSPRGGRKRNTRRKAFQKETKPGSSRIEV